MLHYNDFTKRSVIQLLITVGNSDGKQNKIIYDLNALCQLFKHDR